MTLYPFRFEPLHRRYLWGGRRLERVLGKILPPGEDFAESWEVCDRGGDQSIVAHGPLAGTTLHDLVTKHGRELLGKHHPQSRFPLLWKFLDAHKALSVQVHPNDTQAARLDPPDLGKTEAWVVLHAEPGSMIYAGLKRGFDRAAFERELKRGTCELCLHHFEPREGDCVFLPAGTVHALGAGLVIAEIQQSSDVTYRLFDWNRTGPDGQPRPLHIEQGLAATDFARGPVDPLPPQPTDQPHVERLVTCDKFVLERWTFDTPRAIGGDDRCRIVAVLEGTLTLAGDPVPEPLAKGGVALLPAVAGTVNLVPQGPVTLLAAYLP